MMAFGYGVFLLIMTYSLIKHVREDDKNNSQ